MLAGLLSVLGNSGVAYAQYVPCNILNLAPTGPPTVEAGQTLQVTTTVTGSCDQSLFYAVRVDLVDGRTSQVLSSVVFPYAPVSPVFTVSITNKATAPTTLGAWVLQVNAYLIAAVNGAVVTSSHLLFNVDVVPYTPPPTTTEELTTNSTTTLFMIPTNSTSQTVSNETSLESSSSSATATALETTNQNSTLLSVAAIVIVVGVILAFIIMSKRKGSAARKPETPQALNAKYCTHCGTRLDAADQYCGHCGTKQS